MLCSTKEHQQITLATLKHIINSVYPVGVSRAPRADRDLLTNYLLALPALLPPEEIDDRNFGALTYSQIVYAPDDWRPRETLHMIERQWATLWCIPETYAAVAALVHIVLVSNITCESPVGYLRRLIELQPCLHEGGGAEK